MAVTEANEVVYWELWKHWESQQWNRDEEYSLKKQLMEGLFVCILDPSVQQAYTHTAYLKYLFPD